MTRRRPPPPLDFWLWLAVIGIIAVVAGFVFLKPPQPSVGASSIRSSAWHPGELTMGSVTGARGADRWLDRAAGTIKIR